jgi:hypothetical protein
MVWPHYEKRNESATLFALEAARFKTRRYKACCIVSISEVASS